MFLDARCWGLAVPIGKEGPAHTEEEPKTATRISHPVAIYTSLPHLLPIAISISILTLSWRNVYWQDLGLPHQNAILDALQFAAKAHEISMAMSLSAIVLHRIRYDLIIGQGLPFGFLTSAYLLTDLTYLTSKEFWGGVTARQILGRPWKLLSLGLLIATSCLLTAVVGPSSAIAMIPQLDWWDVRDPFSGIQETCFINMTANDIWPTNITERLLPAAYSCLSQGSDQSEFCPSHGFSDIATWTQLFTNQGQLPNFTISNDGGVNRYLTSATNSPGSGWSVTSTIGARQTRDLGDFWELINEDILTPANLSRPILIPTLPGNLSMLKPLVQVQCRAYSLNNSTNNIEFPSSHLKTFDDSYNGQHWVIPESYYNVSSSPGPGVSFSWVDMSNYTNAPSLGGIFILNVDVNEEQEKEVLTAVPCTIDASWAPVSIWLDPRIDSVVLQDTPDPRVLVDSKAALSKLNHVSISTTWADALNIQQAITTNTPIPQNISSIESLVMSLGYEENPSLYITLGGVEIPDHISNVLGLYLADGLARVNSMNQTFAFQQDSKNSSKTFAVSLDDLKAGHVSYPSQYDSFATYARASGFPELIFNIRRYGYGWSFRSFTVKLAAVILSAQTLLASVHVVFLLRGGWVAKSWDRVGEIVALAIRSDEAEVLRNTGAGIDKVDTWRQRVRVGERDGNLGLVFGDGVESRVKEGKKYM